MRGAINGRRGRQFAALLFGTLLISAAPVWVQLSHAADETQLTRFWIDAEYLYWNVTGDKLPALVTTGPDLRNVSQTVLFGDTTVNDGWRHGGRLRAGYWFDDDRQWAIEGTFFGLADASTHFNASSDDVPILARPIINADTGQQNALLIAFPGFLTGQASVNESSSLLGAGLAIHREICSSCGGRISALFGYRLLRASDTLTIASSQQGTILEEVSVSSAVTDKFETTNYFHGLDLGVTGNLNPGPWSLEWLAKIGFGANVSDVRISGSTTTAVGGGAPVSQTGGLLALPSNSGHTSHTHFAIAPEMNVKVGYQILPQMRLVAGYSFLYWTDLIRPGGTIDKTVNINQLPPATPGGPNRPQPQFERSDLFAHGLTAGLVFNF